MARRLTATLSLVSHPAFSPDGRWLTFVGREDGETEVYLMPAEGGPARRLTYLGNSTTVLGWTPDSQKIVFASNVSQPFKQLTPLYTISREGGQPELLPYGPAHSLAFGPGGRALYATDPPAGLLRRFDVATRKMMGEIEVGAAPVGFVLNPEGTTAYVSSMGDNFIRVVNLETMEVEHEIAAGPVPDGIALASPADAPEIAGDDAAPRAIDLGGQRRLGIAMGPRVATLRHEPLEDLGVPQVIDAWSSVPGPFTAP